MSGLSGVSIGDRAFAPINLSKKELTNLLRWAKKAGLCDVSLRSREEEKKLAWEKIRSVYFFLMLYPIGGKVIEGYYVDSSNPRYQKQQEILQYRREFVDVLYTVNSPYIPWLSESFRIDQNQINEGLWFANHTLNTMFTGYLISKDIFV